MPEKPQITRAEYVHFLPLPTRWMDNDIYGHVNNALYYAFFDTAINEYLIAEGGLDIPSVQWWHLRRSHSASICGRSRFPA